MQVRSLALSAIAIACAAGTARASFDVSAVVTADNHYAIYNVLNESIGFVGRNEVGPDGAPGTYNWSEPETWSFATEDILYIAAWSDDFFAQGVLGQFGFTPRGEGGGGGGPLGTILSGDSRWRVMRTNVNLDGLAPAPTAAAIAAQVALADANNLWRTPTVGDANLPSTQPWGQVGGISNDAQWMWADGGGVFVPGGNFGEYLIFELVIPSPGAASMLALAGVLAARRRRRA